jgi:hypothetical protein
MFWYISTQNDLTTVGLGYVLSYQACTCMITTVGVSVRHNRQTDVLSISYSKNATNKYVQPGST